MNNQTPPRDARTMTHDEYKRFRSEAISNSQREASRRDLAAEGAAELARMRKKFPDQANENDKAARDAAHETWTALVKRAVAAELALFEAAKQRDAVASSPSELDRQRAADRLTALARERDALVLETEAAQAVFSAAGV